MESSRTARSAGRPVWPWLAATGLAVLAGAAATRITGLQAVVFILAVVAIALYFWRSADPFVPFLVLVAAVQGGVLLKLQAEGGSFQTIMPFLGGGCCWLCLRTGHATMDLPCPKHGAAGSNPSLQLL
jgi:hypothetical protein